MRLLLLLLHAPFSAGSDLNMWPVLAGMMPSSPLLYPSSTGGTIRQSAKNMPLQPEAPVRWQAEVKMGS